MSEQAQEPSRSELIEQAWAAAQAEAPAEPQAEAAPAPEAAPASEEPSTEPAITKESLNELSTKNTTSIREFIRAQQPKAEPDGLELEVRELRSALAELRQAGSPKEKVSEMQAVLAELQQLREREAQRLQQEEQAKAENEYSERERVLRQGVVENLRSRKEDFPALFAMEQEDSVATELFNRLGAGQDASDFAVASEFESALWELYNKLHALKTPAPSEDKPASEPKTSVTLTNDLVGADAEEDLSGLSRQQLIDRAWAKANR